jgi:hypothetical protein
MERRAMRNACCLLQVVGVAEGQVYSLTLRHLQSPAARERPISQTQDS